MMGITALMHICVSLIQPLLAELFQYAEETRHGIHQKDADSLWQCCCPAGWIFHAACLLW